MIRNIQNGKELSREMQENQIKFTLLVDRHLPEHIEQAAQKLIDESFQKETYQDGKSAHWKQRKNDKEANKPRTERNGILVKDGTLIATTNVERRGKDIIIGSDTKYSQRHNEGLAKMPKRQFMPIPGESNPILDKEVEKYIDSEMDKIFK